MQPFFSIIIPVYNTQEYIVKCLESCLDQTFTDFEAIIVDDCGQDNSIIIAQKYAQKDKRFCIINNPHNLGLFHTRITGEIKAKGKYILCLDSDDFLNKDALQIIYSKIMEYYKKTNSYIDIVHFDFDFYPSQNENNMCFNSLGEFNSLVQNASNLVDNYFISHKYLSWNIWDKAYRSSIIKDVDNFILSKLSNMKNFVSCEDAFKTFLIILFAKNSIKITQKLYYYAFIQKDETITMSRIDDARYVISLLDTLDQTPIALANPSYMKAKVKIQKQIKQNIETVLYRGMGGGDMKYIKYQINLLKIDFRWQNVAKILLFLLTFGKIKK